MKDQEQDQEQEQEQKQEQEQDQEQDQDDVWNLILDINYSMNYFINLSDLEENKQYYIDFCLKCSKDHFKVDVRFIKKLSMRWYILLICAFCENHHTFESMINDFWILFDQEDQIENKDIGLKKKCLAIGCKYNRNLEIIKYLIQCTDTDHLDMSSYFMLACENNTNVEVIKYLYEHCLAPGYMDQIVHTDDVEGSIRDITDDVEGSIRDIFDHRRTRRSHECDHKRCVTNGANCLKSAYKKNISIEVIKYLIQCNQTENIYCTDYTECFMLACGHNHNVNVIKYLIQCHEIDVPSLDNDGRTCLMLACQSNKLEVIKYLIQYFNHMNINQMNINQTDYYGRSCLALACMGNTNLDVIKYLIDDCKMDVNFQPHKLYPHLCLTNACAHNPNIKISKYLIEHTDARIGFEIELVRINTWANIVQTITNNFNRFNEFLTIGIDHYGAHKFYQIDLIIILQKMNPLLVPGQYLDKYYITDPFDDMVKYEDFVKHVDELVFQIPVPLKQKLPESVHSESMGSESVLEQGILDQVIEIESGSNDLLFNHNGQTYYGSREIVYRSIDCLREIYEIANFDDPVTLSGQAPRYIMDQWIRSMENNKFDLMLVLPKDLMEFLKLIDMYPTQSLGIQQIEQDLIQRIDGIDFMIFSQSDIWYMRDMMKRYRLKRLYLCLHNKMQGSDSRDKVD
jgi:hypothetical protein